MSNLWGDVKKIEEDIETLEKFKIDILMMIDFPLWNRLTNAMEGVCKCYINFIKNENELGILEDLYDEEKYRQIRKLEILNDMEEIKSNIKVYIKDRNEILKDFSEEKIKEFQDVYIKISELDQKRFQIMQLINMKYE
ncbi:hypothetical protein [Clostridium algidicarnis]|uniref:Uncharacterized protein n=2 Tax=Clostridium algidicarnis TaxID=37659 RepID=A0A2S6FXP2_9CLOT|nr:hypothetical protein [Clostridium algidicarnis]MBB6631305.1 hypothetical protein [Clostridium algidicarnis]MBB6697576.1 hypothetical protein [Clostridium algidicarnis]MBU3219807.1 hypothetical protein [Clostridium algidicarnis]PPK48376.1 hypothetical protein BD821_10713 [Clostridium algidicarnis DSM 15099]